MKLRTAQNWLVGGWLIVGLLVLAILIMQWLNRKYDDKWQGPFDWYSAMILPTLALLVAYFFPRRTAASGSKDASAFIPAAAPSAVPREPTASAATAADIPSPPIATKVATARGSQANGQIAGISFAIAFFLNLAYLFGCLGVVLATGNDAPLARLKESETVLHGIQILSALSLGWFFVAKQDA
jgi:hypothetical protein